MGEQKPQQERVRKGTLPQVKDFVVSAVYQDFKNEITEMITYYHMQMEGSEVEREMWKYQGALGALRAVQTMFERLIEELENP